VNSLESMQKEFREEVATTRRVLDQVPVDKLGWKPHERSMSLGQLALHIASVPGGIAKITKRDAFDVSQNTFNPPMPKSMNEVHAALEQSVRDVEQTFKGNHGRNSKSGLALDVWRQGTSQHATSKRLAILMLNHWYHHRGQLAVYVRLLDVPVLSIYGPSADQNPFS
jgi:uncharacterized damage-inducible protein DinB